MNRSTATGNHTAILGTSFILLFIVPSVVGIGIESPTIRRLLDEIQVLEAIGVVQFNSKTPAVICLKIFE